MERIALGARPPRNRAAMTLLAVLRAAALSALFGACALLSHYDPTSYKNATDLKAESLIVLERATEPYDQHATEVDQLTIRLRQAYEYERGKDDNAETAEQWQILVDPGGNLLGGTLKRWKEQGQLTDVFLTEISGKIEKGFDEIIELEQGKVKN